MANEEKSYMEGFSINGNLTLGTFIETRNKHYPYPNYAS